MTYPTPPGPRIAYDTDGTIGFVSGNSGARGATQVHPRFLESLNADSSKFGKVSTSYWGETTAGVNNQNAPVGAWFAMRFPVVMRIRAITFHGHWGPETAQEAAYILNATIETSQDSTNGQDGTWSTLRAYTGAEGDLDVNPSGRSVDRPTDQTSMYGWTSVPGTDQSSTFSVELWSIAYENFRKQNGVTGSLGWREVAGAPTRQVRWVRIRVAGLGPQIISGFGTTASAAMLKLHLYGEPDTTADERRLQFVDDLGGQKLFFDWGDVTPGQEMTQEFRIKNLSTVETASGVSVGILPSNPDVPPNPHSWLRMSLDGVAWDSVVVLPDLAPGVVSDPVTLRLQVGENLVGPWGPRMTAEVEEWV